MSENAAVLERPEVDHVETKEVAHAPFSGSEVDTFHGEDRHTGMAIVGIMTAIFVAALVAYTGILAWVMQHPNG